jgi:hypothetical protein
MKYAVEMGSGGMIYIPSFIKTGSRIHKLIRGIHRHTDTQTAWRWHKPTFFLFFFQNMETRLIIGVASLFYSPFGTSKGSSTLLVLARLVLVGRLVWLLLVLVNLRPHYFS